MEVSNELSEKARHDLVLVEQAKGGNEKAFATLLNRYRDSIYFMMLKMVSNSADAEDLTIEAFGKAFRSLDSYTPNFAFSTWLFKIATNNCIDFIRKKQSSPSIVDHGQDEDGDLYKMNIQSDTPDPEESLINHQKIMALREVVNQLKPRYRRLIDLRYFKEYSYEEISAELKIPIGTVKAQLFRAKSLLFNILNKTGTR
ncbi:MAG: sigma-70 family RNA polymerase sigma factor [Bacteroidales bacterium]